MAGCVCVTKPRIKRWDDDRIVSLTDHDRRPDLCIETHEGSLVTDVAVVCHTAPTYVKKRWSTVVRSREAYKTSKFSAVLAAQGKVDGVEYMFNAFIVSVHGELGDKARLVLMSIAEEAVRNGRANDDMGFYHHSLKLIAVALARGNACIGTAVLRSAYVTRSQRHY